MAGLTGDFSAMPLKDLVSYLGTRRASGRLTLERGEVAKQVQLREGLVVSASSNQPREYLGQFLINTGTITEDQFIRAYETQKETKIPLGKILVMTGTVSEQAVLNALSIKFRETLLEAFGWTDGTFSFDLQDTSGADEGMELNLDLLDLHKEGEFRETAWQSLRSAFPSGAARLEVLEENLAEPPRPGSLDERLVGLIREGHSIDEMVLALHATDFFLYQRLYALYRLDAVKVRPDEPTRAPPESVALPPGGTSPKELRERALAALEGNRFREAEAMAQQAMKQEASPENVDLVRRAEALLLEALRRTLVSGEPVARMEVAPSQVKGLPLSAPERYLLSRVDGKRTAAAIVRASPLHELQGLKLLDNLLERKLISLRPG
ncbi:MAG TPA: DUF4388 domain-containing protein [Myxococcaceae bacterium]|nr:DUF4388 domain-containing protein [Myxococcaceae bacterium]